MTVRESNIKGAGMNIFPALPLRINQCLGILIGLDTPVDKGKDEYS